MRHYYFLLICSLLMLTISSCDHSKKTANAAASTPVGKNWTVSSFAATDVIQDSRSVPTIRFEEAGKLNGNTGCNNYSGSYSISNNSIKMDPGMMTKMFCEGAVENKFIETMKKANRFEIKGDQLWLFDGTTLVMQLKGK